VFHSLKQYYVFMCSNCRQFTNAPVGQKNRRCSYCGKIINISKAAVALFDSQDAAMTAVKQFNAKGSDEFDRAVERSRERIRALIPSETLAVDENHGEGQESATPPSSKMDRLMGILNKEGSSTPCNLDRLRELCEKKHLEWEWVEESLSKLAEAGVLTFPRPWYVQLVRSREEHAEKPISTSDVTKSLISLLRDHNGEMSVREILRHYQTNGVTQDSVEASLDRLMHTGKTFEPKPGVIRLV